MPINMIILGHRGEGCTNRLPEARKAHLQPRNDPFYQGEILPENSLSSFESALKHGADGIECDVYVSKDGVAMVTHDDQLARNIDGYHLWEKGEEGVLGYVHEKTRQELQMQFTIGNGEKMPTLDELIQLILSYNKAYHDQHGVNYTINIELKGGAAIAKATYDIVKQYIDKLDSPLKVHDFLFNSFEPECLSAMIHIDARMRCALGFSTVDLHKGEKIIMPGWIPESKDSYPKKVVTEVDKTIKDLHLAGLDVVTADVNPELVTICKRNKVFLNAATNALRLKLEAQYLHTPEEHWTDLQREMKEVEKLAKISVDNNILVYYKADNPGFMKQYLETLKKSVEATQKSSYVNIKLFPESKKDLKTNNTITAQKENIPPGVQNQFNAPVESGTTKLKNKK